jgi:3-hydroxyisobutyrate dehydrogenase
MLMKTVIEFIASANPMASKHQRISFIGMGLMGSAMTSRLIHAGYPVKIWNRDPAKFAAVVTVGTKQSRSLKDLFGASDIVLLCLSDTLAAQAVVFDSDEFTVQRCADKTLIVFSSIAPSSTVEFTQTLKSETDMNWIDSPVSDGSAGTESGELCAMVGGDCDAIDYLPPVLTHLTKRVTHMGNWLWPSHQRMQSNDCKCQCFGHG